jgi:hypothetical protein
VRLLARFYFGAGLHRLHVRRQLRPRTRRTVYGPSRRLVGAVVLVWLLVLVLIVNLIALTLRGLDIH